MHVWDVGDGPKWESQTVGCKLSGARGRDPSSGPCSQGELHRAAAPPQQNGVPKVQSRTMSGWVEDFRVAFFHRSSCAGFTGPGASQQVGESIGSNGGNRRFRDRHHPQCSRACEEGIASTSSRVADQRLRAVLGQSQSPSGGTGHQRATVATNIEEGSKRLESLKALKQSQPPPVPDTTSEVQKLQALVVQLQSQLAQGGGAAPTKLITPMDCRSEGPIVKRCRREDFIHPKKCRSGCRGDTQIFKRQLGQDSFKKFRGFPSS